MLQIDVIFENLSVFDQFSWSVGVCTYFHEMSIFYFKLLNALLELLHTYATSTVTLNFFNVYNNKNKTFVSNHILWIL